MTWRDKPLPIRPGLGIGPFELGQTRAQVQELTREPLESFFPQRWSKTRADDHPLLGVTVSYTDEGVVNHIAGHVRKRGGESTLVYEGQLLRDATRATLKMLLELLDAKFQDTGEALEVGALGLRFGLRELGDEPGEDDPCDYVVVTSPKA